jgi:formylmethanofuran:tetrahydromethanopterin formyltransferase
MARVLNDLDTNKITEVKARTLGYLCSVLKDVIKDSDLEARVSRLEREIENGNNRETN